MATIVKLSSSDARAWTHNQPVWVDEAGEIVRPVSREEQHAISKTLEKSTRIKQSFRAELALYPLNSTGRRTVRSRMLQEVPKLDAAFEVTYVGEKRVVTVWNGSHRYATGRECLAARLLADHGECILHGRNGKCIGYLKDPFVTQRAPRVGPRVQWSRNPKDPRKSEAQRSDLTDAADLQRVAPEKRRRRMITPQTRKELYSPAKCPNDCRGQRDGGKGWKIQPGSVPPTADEHHPMCKFAATWAATLENPETTEVLYDLETSEVRRSATPAEIEESRANAPQPGMMPQITIGGRVYAVMSRADAEQAAREARGEIDGDEVDSLTTGDSLIDRDDDESDGEGDEVDLAAPTAYQSKRGDRQSWPSLDDLGPRKLPLRASDPSPRDYLARPQSAEASDIP